ncbi:transposase family protein [Lachnospiraceae bacterium MD1]|jgi:hypothetical protein|uniref:Transposase family protein n=1 Tax=Variimorphobacter saccharofermentans TaxID=2755051 RepID=A0A839JUL6_9FIRM|nr:transposase family protein [Variimorphobacter saccharofermentans]MBB2181375.1 transposase family protein [Variimorphobacter saccharofermentans]MBB2182613.1 transposase family protein [Variimorphobacter saccharofermentans]
MKRAEKRQLKKSEGNPLVELLKVQKHFYSNLWNDFAAVHDPRHSSYIDYTCDVMLAMPLMKNICDIRSMQEMTETFNTEDCIANAALITEKKELSELPHYVTVNDFLSRLNPDELSNIRSKMIKALIRKRSFEKARFLGQHWLVIVDATQLYTFNNKNDDQCLTRTFTNKETGEKTTQYYHSVLEAKIVLGDDLVVSIASEFIENDGEDTKKQKKMSVEEIKQDCETKAFERLATKLKKAFPRLPICIMGDSLYASEKVFQICDDNQWKYLIRFKDGSIPSVATEFHILKEREVQNQRDGARWVNGIGYNKRMVNVMEFIFQKAKKQLRFQWITNIEITKKKVLEFTATGRKRWMIENEGFNIQKNYRYEITHANSKNYNAMKNHYLITQIADIILQLYEKAIPIIKELKKSIKNISSDLLASFGRQLTREDISYTEKRTSLSIS